MDLCLLTLQTMGHHDQPWPSAAVLQQKFPVFLFPSPSLPLLTPLHLPPPALIGAAWTCKTRKKNRCFPPRNIYTWWVCVFFLASAFNVVQFVCPPARTFSHILNNATGDVSSFIGQVMPQILPEPVHFPIFPKNIKCFNGLVYGKNYRKTPYLIRKSMVSCRFSLKPIHWMLPDIHPAQRVSRSREMKSGSSASQRSLASASSTRWCPKIAL